MTTYYLPRYVCPYIAPTRKGRLFGLGDEAVQCTLEADFWILQRKNELSEEFCITDTAVQRGADTSSLWTPDGLHRGFYYIQYTQKPHEIVYGCDWSPLWMDVGQKFTRNAYIVEYWWDGRIKAQYPATTVLKFVAFHDEYTFLQSGITVQNVVELNWEGEENYFYGENFGLVGWLNVKTGAGSYLGSLAGVVIQPPYPHPVPRPAAQPPPEEYPVSQTIVIPPVKGTPKPMTVNAPAGVKHRTDGDTSAAVLRIIPDNTPVTGYPDTAKPNDGFTWWFCETAAGEPGWAASEYLAPVETPEPPPSTDVIYTEAEHAALVSAYEELGRRIKGTPSGGL